MRLRESSEVCLILALLIGLYIVSRSGSVEAHSEPEQSNNANSTAFDPCRCSSKISPATKKYLKKALPSVMSSCSLKMFSVLNYPWGLPADVLAFIPRGIFLSCLSLRAAYGQYIDSTGHLPRAMVSNATRIYDIGHTLLKAVFNDYSVTKKLCVHKVGPDGHSVCYEKSHILRISIILLSCIQNVLENSVPDTMDGALAGTSSMVKRIGHSKFIAYTGK